MTEVLLGTGVFRTQPRGTIQKIPNNIDFLNSAPGVVYRKLWYVFNNSKGSLFEWA